MDDWKLTPAHDLGLDARARARHLRRESGLIETAGHHFWGAFVRFYLGIYHRLRIECAEHIPRKPPFILISNHCSHLDTMALAASLPWRIQDYVFPIAAGDVFFETPAVSFFAAGMINALPMWRRKCGTHAMEVLRQRLIEEPCAYILFPEGTRSRDGIMGPFKAGLGMLVAGTPVPVIPCHLSGTSEALPAGCKIPRCRRIVLRIGKPLHFESTSNDRPGWNQIAQATEAAVRQLQPFSRP